LISRPMQISTRVGVVHAMVVPFSIGFQLARAAGLEAGSPVRSIA
jgi:hypothetical protein